MKCIIPCAGYGTRVNMKPNQSKELLIDTLTDKPMINFSLSICDYYGMEPLVITRHEKKDLVDYLEREEIEFMYNDPNRQGEWMDSVLQTRPKWDKYNILMFPDTRFRPTEIIDEMKRDLTLGANCSIALHKVKDPEKWCVLGGNCLYEKPSLIPPSNWAFGIIAFTDTYGEFLFKELSNLKFCELDNASFKYLDSFIDLTRG